MSKPFKFPIRYKNFLKLLAGSGINPSSDKEGWVEKTVEKKKWSRKTDAKCGWGGGHVFVSPCGQFIAKYSYIAFPGYRGGEDLPTRAVPTHFSQPGEKYQWLMQPNCDISPAAIDKAETILCRLAQSEKGTDSHSGNVGMWNGEAVVFDF